MDQIRPLLALAGKHLFWIVTGIAVMMGVGGFFLARANLTDLFTEQKKTLDKHYSNIGKVRQAIRTHPNAISKVKMEAAIAILASEVGDAWQVQYDRQAKSLVWPDTIKETSPTLVRKLESYRPIEIKLDYPAEPPRVTKGEKRTFAEYFDRQMPKLTNIIGVEWVGEVGAATGGMGGMDDGGGMDALMGRRGALPGSSRDLVNWDKESQDALISSIRLWAGDTPSVYEILYTQENMWILEGLLNIIKETNGSAQANFQCAIKEIEFIRIGRTAVGKAGSITTPGVMGGMGGMGGMMDGMDDMDMTGFDGEEGDDGDYGLEAVVTDPANGRYVDADFAAVTGDDLRSKMKSEDPEDAYFAVAKRVPVRLRFTIDQRKTQSFLASCANATMPLEVRQMRLGDTTAAVAGAAGNMGGMGGMAGMDMMMGGMDMMGDEGGDEGGGDMDMDAMMMGMDGGGMAAMGTVPKIDPWTLPIEVYGVVYLYNPVDIERLGLDKVTEDTELEDTVDTPADATASPPVPVPDASDNDNPDDDKAEGPAPGTAEAPADIEVPVPDDAAEAPASGG